MLTHCHTPNSRLGPAQAPRSSKLLPGASPRAAGALPRRLKPARSLPVPPPPGAEDAGEETKFEQRQRLKESVGQGAFGGGAADEGAQQAAGGGAAQGAQRGGAEGQGSLPWSARASPATRAAATHAMAFFQRVMSYLLNEVLVNGLANSRTFQRFAIRSSSLVEEAAKKTAEHKQQLGEHGSTFFKVFREEMTKGLKEVNSKTK
ncbi:hypothetical protein CHLNCDRAFT_141167 [Chlorella variabilis]|uniref:Uncharacterized protein n=1 Tax=Chlorella variabilis TaxID=554065 RepID=E1ZS83_CHLVA|nr:hypothetical protein CHLNCDRAFT_141167 [Chlorella variabilis]EFN51259.1 hypothetical protein CHLNCDRAFT_141167 [Chlorella variabilis]|eukprot:XP_005843361.1 hypothetical protein CHLNCDRAFT_141167 [Chlorella variabilis]